MTIEDLVKIRDDIRQQHIEAVKANDNQLIDELSAKLKEANDNVYLFAHGQKKMDE